MSVKSCAGVYGYGFNGMEKDDEWKGSGNSYNTEFRINDPRLGKWLSVDPLAASYPWQSTYVSMDNNPINLTDPQGLGTDWYVSNVEGSSSEAIWLPSDAAATTHFGDNSFINLGENLASDFVITPEGGTQGQGYSVPNYLINAKSEYGQKDSQHKDQKGQNPRVLEYHSTTKNPDTGKPYTSDETAWCASFINWNIIAVGLPSNENKFNATATGYHKWNTQYTKLDKPAIGAIAVIKTTGGYHVTFVVGVYGNYIHGYGGNQGNQVKISTWNKTKVSGYYLPVGVVPNYNVPVVNFNKTSGEGTR
jgi:uncharacterized protein (TIGR02594 family)